LDESIALVEFSKHSERAWSKPFDYAHIEVGLKIWNPHRPWLEDYDVACPAGCGETFRRSFLATHAVGCVVSARELPGLPGLGRAAAGWTSDARFWRERGPPCWRRADERGGNWPEIPDD